MDRNKTKPNLIKTTAVMVAIAMLTQGCASLDSKARQKVDQSFDNNYKKSTEEVSRVTAQKEHQYMTKLKGSWMGGKSIPVTYEAALPAAFTDQWNFIFPGRVNIATAAERITRVTGFPVRVKPDVFMDISKLVNSGSETALDPANNANVVMPPTLNASVNKSYAANYSTDMELNFQGSLSDFLDRVCSRATINWEYKNGTIELFRLVTKNYTLRVSPGDSNFTSTIGKTGSTQGGTSGSSGSSSATSSSFASDSNVKVTSAYNVWTSVESAIKASLSPIGKVSVNQATGTITVTDNKDNVDEVTKLLERENLMLTRQVRMKVEVINVKLNRDFQNGVDWNVVYQRLNSLLDPKFTINFATPTSLVGAEAGSLGFTINNSGQGTGLDRFAGSSAMLKALSTLGKATVTNTTSAVTTNRQPVPVAITNQVAYIAATTPSGSNVPGGLGGLPGLTPGVVTTGFILNLLPTVHDNGSVLVQFSMDMSELTRLRTVTSGQGVNQQSIQTPEVSSTQILQRASLRPGETLVLTGFDRQNSRYDKRTLTEDSESFLGGSIDGTNTKEVSVIMITPVIEDQ